MSKAIVAILFSVVLMLNLPKKTEKHSCGMGPDCGCVNRRSCGIPCATCCGPNGIADCFLHPDPTAKVKQ